MKTRMKMYYVKIDGKKIGNVFAHDYLTAMQMVMQDNRECVKVEFDGHKTIKASTHE